MLSCTLEVDMRSTRKDTLEDIRKNIEPAFQAGASPKTRGMAARMAALKASPSSWTWFGLRPAYVAESVDNPAVHAGLQSGIQLGAITHRWSAPDRAA